MADEKKQDLTIKVQPSLRARLEALRDRQDRSLGWLVERCLEAHLPVMETAAGVMHDAPQVEPPREQNKPIKYRVSRPKRTN